MVGQAPRATRKGSRLGWWLASAGAVGLLVFAVTSCDPTISTGTVLLWVAVWMVGRHIDRQREEIADLRSRLEDDDEDDD